MKCTSCGCLESKVTDSRQSEDGLKIRRRRECLNCGERFTTYEVMETVTLLVKKKDGSTESFDNRKLLKSLVRACGKRPVSAEALEKIVSEIENHFLNSMLKVVNSSDIAELAMQKLKQIDQVAYIRFASVYKEFTDVNSFVEELKNLND
ncbi:MAG: transcriptional regulator NrdR [Oscillospiraceae bacterium]